MAQSTEYEKQKENNASNPNQPDEESSGSRFAKPRYSAAIPPRQTVEFSVKGPVSLYLEDDQPTSPGCAVLDIIFSTPATVGELTFRNYYTQSISLFVRYSDDGTVPKPTDPGFASYHDANGETSRRRWIVAVEKKELMKYIHYEQGSQDFISIPATESSVEWTNLSAIRLILKQPSSVWHTFHVEELNVYKDQPKFSARSHGYGGSSEQCQQLNKLMTMIRNQTYEALTWTPKQESVGGTSKSSPRLSLRDHQKMGGYEVVLLPPYTN